MNIISSTLVGNFSLIPNAISHLKELTGDGKNLAVKKKKKKKREIFLLGAYYRYAQIRNHFGS